eukprot:4456994-Prymnesium_polylepis.1
MGSCGRLPRSRAVRVVVCVETRLSRCSPTEGCATHPTVHMHGGGVWEDSRWAGEWWGCTKDGRTDGRTDGWTNGTHFAHR